MNLLDWLNTNLGVMQAIAIAVQAISAIFIAAYVFLTWRLGSAAIKQAEASRQMAQEMKGQRYSESLPLLVPEITPSTFRHGVDPNHGLYLDLQVLVGVKVLWRNLGKGVALNLRFSFWAVPDDPPSGKVLFFPPQESTALGIGEQKEIEGSETWRGGQFEKPEAYRPRLIAKYHDIYEREITTIQEFRIDEQAKKADRGELYFTVNGRRLGEEVAQYDSGGH